VVGRQNADIADTLQLRNVATATNFLICKLTLMGDNDMGISYKEWFVFSQPLRLLVTLSGFVVETIGTAPGGRLSGWELTR